MKPENRALFLAVTAIWPLDHASPHICCQAQVVDLVQSVARLMENHPAIAPLSVFLGCEEGYDRSRLWPVIWQVSKGICILRKIEWKE